MFILQRLLWRVLELNRSVGIHIPSRDSIGISLSPNYAWSPFVGKICCRYCETISQDCRLNAFWCVIFEKNCVDICKRYLHRIFQ